MMNGDDAMATSKVERLAERVMGDVFSDADPGAVQRIVDRFLTHEISEQAALQELREVQGRGARHLISFDKERLPQEWNEIVLAIENSERRYLKKAQQQFLLGTFSLPFFIAVIIFSLSFGWQGGAGAGVASGLLGAALVSLAAHAFFVLRVHQQASTAAERLAEKRLALLFLKVALGSVGDERRSLLEAGTAMFLGHQAPETLPLSPQDWKFVKERGT